MPLLTTDRVRAAIERIVPFRMDADVPPRFQSGDRVRTRNIHPVGHTRLPRYARSRPGVIARDHGVFVFADASGDGHGKVPQRLYSVRFTAQELWGPAASPRDPSSGDVLAAERQHDEAGEDHQCAGDAAAGMTLVEQERAGQRGHHDAHLTAGDDVAHRGQRERVENREIRREHEHADGGRTPARRSCSRPLQIAARAEHDQEQERVEGLDQERR
jgi:nitrile hydratase beta subunit-like protein